MDTKKFFITLLCIFSFVSAFAENKDLGKDITMVSYEQSWLDNYGTIALKNNTNEEINNIVFQITYLDMSGNELDYEVFEREVNIAPGKTRKIDLPAYEHSRQYHYYKTKDEFGNPAFKINYQLIDYNVEEDLVYNADSYHESSNYDNMNNPLISGISGKASIIICILSLFFIGICVGLYVLVAVMAKKRNRNVVVWILLSLIATPILMIIILWAIGKDNNHNERLR